MPPVKESEANSPLLDVPIVERVMEPAPEFKITVRKSPVAASRGERVIAPPLVFTVKSVPAERDIVVSAKEMTVAALVKVVREPAVKKTEGAI